MKMPFIVFALLALLILLLFLLSRKTRSPAHKACTSCGAESQHGYSERAEEDPENIKPMCTNCLVSQLERDYVGFAGRAVVVQPVAGPPCYVFQPVKEWDQRFKESKITDDVLSLLANMETTCRDCGLKANYLWIESDGLTADNFGELLDSGLSETLLRRNPKPISLCGNCCGERIARELKAKAPSYLEVCGPEGTDDGFVLPMAY